jgi:hypothetical protein
MVTLTRSHAHTLTLFLLFSFFSSLKLSSQASLFLNELSPGNVTFTASEQAAWDSIAQNASTNSMLLVEVAHLPTALSNDQLTFLLPGTLDTLHAKGFYFQKENDTTYTWWGEFSGHRGHLGIAANDSGKVVAMSLDGVNYMFHPLSARYNAQVELKQDTFTMQEPEIEPPVNITTDPSCDFDDCKGIATVLVLLTPEAVDEILGRYHVSIQGVFAPVYLALGVQTLNFALLNSGIVGKSARFITEPFEEFEYDPFNDISSDLQNLAANSTAWGHYFVNRADLMILLTDSRYVPYLGAADLINNNLAIVSANYMWGPDFVFTHEVGHLLGARHNRESNGGDEPDEDVCNFGYRFLLAGITPRYTVMAKMLDPGDQRVLAFSNPRITAAGTPIGTGDSDNAAYISKTFCDVADMQADDELQVDISGSLSIVCPQTATYTLNIDPPGAGIPGNGPYYISWVMGEAPFSHPNQQGAISLGHSSSATINSANINYDKLWLYVHILSSDGVMASDLIEVEIDPCAPIPKATAQSDFTVGQPYLRIYPNPSVDHLILHSTLPESSANGDYFISNALGEVVSAGNFSTNGKDDLQEFHFALDAGIYSLQVRTQSNVYSCKFIVQH